MLRLIWYFSEQDWAKHPVGFFVNSSLSFCWNNLLLRIRWESFVWYSSAYERMAKFRNGFCAAKIPTEEGSFLWFVSLDKQRNEQSIVILHFQQKRNPGYTRLRKLGNSTTLRMTKYNMFEYRIPSFRGLEEAFNTPLFPLPCQVPRPPPFWPFQLPRPELRLLHVGCSYSSQTFPLVPQTFAE